MKNERTHIFKNTVFQKANESAKTVFSGPGQMEIEPAAEFGGSGQALNPEEMFVAAINSCLMNTFFYFVRKMNVEILSYYSEALGQVEKQRDGFRFTNVEVRAEITLKQQEPAEKISQLRDLAEKYCLVSRSAACSVDYQLKMEIEGK